MEDRQRAVGDGSPRLSSHRAVAALQHLPASPAAGDLGRRSGRRGSDRRPFSGEVRLSIRAFAAVTIAVLGLPAWALAQSSPVSLGVVAGADVADQAGEDVFAPHDRIGFIGGVSGSFRFASRWAIQVDGLYVQKGGRENNDNDPEDPFDDALSLEYLEYPILLKKTLFRFIHAIPSVRQNDSV